MCVVLWVNFGACFAGGPSYQPACLFVNVTAFRKNLTPGSDGSRRPALSPETRVELVTFLGRSRSWFGAGETVCIVHDTVTGGRMWLFSGHSASCISVITWGFTLCQQSLRCSVALRTTLVGFYARSFTHENRRLCLLAYIFRKCILLSGERQGKYSHESP